MNNLRLKIFFNSLKVMRKYNYFCLSPMALNAFRKFSSEPVDLAYSYHSPTNELPPSDTPIIILHGLLGSKLNWRTLANVIATKHERKVYALDARNHGDSPHSEHFDYNVMASDVSEFMFKNNIPPSIIIGHSMGGRTAMTLALTKPDLVEKLVVVDVSPSHMPKASHNLQEYVLIMKDVLKHLSANINLTEARKLLSDHLITHIPDLSIRQFLLTNLIKSESGFKWKANVEVIAKSFFTSVVRFPDLKGTYNGKTLFICGKKSPYVSVDDHDFIRKLFPNAMFIYIEDAGHWVHSEKPQEFLEALKEILLDL